MTQSRSPVYDAMQTLPRPFEGLKVLSRATRPPGSSFQPRRGLHIEQRTYSISTGTGFWELSVIRFSTWGPAHMRWLMEQKLEHREQRIAFEELLEGIRQESERMERLEGAIRDGSTRVVARRGCRGSGIDLIAAVGLVISPASKIRAS
jgi:hypothetical protein